MAYGDHTGPLRAGYCKASVHERGMGVRFYQCERKAVKDGYCKQHHPDAVAARRKAADERYEAKWAQSPVMKLVAVRERHAKLVIALESIREEHADMAGLVAYVTSVLNDDKVSDDHA